MFRNIPFLILLAIYVQKHSFSHIACNLCSETFLFSYCLQFMFRNIPFLILLAIYVQKHSFSHIAQKHSFSHIACNLCSETFLSKYCLQFMFRNIPFLILLAINVQKHTFANIACNLWKIKFQEYCKLATFFGILNSLTFPQLFSFF